MAYTDRTATTGSPIAITFAKMIDLPALPENQNGWDTPVFLSGLNLFTTAPDFESSNKPTLWSTSYDSRTPLFTGNLVMGVAHADYAKRETGTGAADENSEYFEKEGLIDGMYVGVNYTLTPAGFGYYSADVAIEFQRQVLGNFTGGVASVVSANAAETQTITFEDYLNTAGISYIGAALASTMLAPSALFIMHPGYADGPDGPTAEAVDKVGAYKIAAAGAITQVGLFKTDVAANPTQGAIYSITAQCRDDTHHYFIRAGNSTSTSFTSCLETAWDTFTYTNYTPKFSDPDLPATLGTLIEGDATYKLLAIYGTDVGFLISYLKFDGSLWQPKFVLVDKGWTTVQHITATAGDATATTILAQGVRDPANPPAEGRDFAANAISMMTEGGYTWLLGGTPASPLIVEGTGGPAPAPVTPTDDSLTIRCWPFSLDDHDFGVFRLGSSATLAFDLKTRQWSEWRSPNRTNWRAHIGCNWVGMADTLGNYATDVVCGDDLTGVLYILDPTYGEDDNTDTGSLPFTRMIIGGIALDGRDTAPCGAVQLTASLGNPSLTGAAITLRTSDDAGHSYTSHGSQTITAGVYDQVVEWRALGLMRQPGRIFEVSDNGVKRIGRLSLR